MESNASYVCIIRISSTGELCPISFALSERHVLITVSTIIVVVVECRIVAEEFVSPMCPPFIAAMSTMLMSASQYAQPFGVYNRGLTPSLDGATL